MRIKDKPRNLIALIRHNRLVQKRSKGQIGKDHLGGNAFNRTTRGNPGKLVPSTRRRRLSEQVLEVPKTIRDAVDGVVRRHKFLAGNDWGNAQGNDCWMQSIMLTLRSLKSAGDSPNSIPACLSLPEQRRIPAH